MFGSKEKKEKRFKILCEESTNMVGIMILVDKETGVNYLFTQGVSGVGLTPLLNEQGNIVVTSVEEEE